MTSTNAPEAPTEWWRVDGAALVTEYLNLETRRRRAEAEQGRILAEIASRGVRDTTGYGTLTALIRESVHVSTADALARVNRAKALNPGRDLTGARHAPLAPATADAARDGAIGNAQIDAITAILDKLPATVSDFDREQGEKILVDLARTAGTREITKAGNQLLDRLGAHGEPLDVGRARRSATPAQRCVLTIRDGGCAFPGCDAPPQRCTAHHIVFWAHHGETKISNLVFLCAAHHNLIHYSDWKVRIAEDGLPEFIPPAYLDPTRTPRRNTLHQRI